MCNVLVKDPTSVIWQLAVTDLGILTVTPTTLKTDFVHGPILTSGSLAWQIAITTVGDLAVSPVTSALGIPYIALTSPNGTNFKLSYNKPTNQFLVQSTAGVLVDVVPVPFDITMSRWPEGFNGINCPSCGNASITVSGDFSCWCCVCSSFVPPDDTTIIVALSE